MCRVYGQRFHTLALFIVLVLFAGGAQAGGAEPFEPIDAQALINACWKKIPQELRDLGGTRQGRADMIVTVKCLRETLLDQHSVLAEGYILLQQGDDGVDIEELRREWDIEHQDLAKEGSCYPSCAPIEESPDLEWAARIGEVIVRDFVAERNLFRFPDNVSPSDFRASVFSETVDADILIEGCWDISEEMRGAGVTGLSRYGTMRSVLCLEEVIIDMVDVFGFSEDTLTRAQTRVKLRNLGFAAGSLFSKFYNEHHVCGGAICGVGYYTNHLLENARILERMIRVIIDLRKKYDF